MFKKREYYPHYINNIFPLSVQADILLFRKNRKHSNRLSSVLKWFCNLYIHKKRTGIFRHSFRLLKITFRTVQYRLKDNLFHSKKKETVSKIKRQFLISFGYQTSNYFISPSCIFSFAPDFSEERSYLQHPGSSL